MIDTLRFRLEDFEIAKKHKLYIQPGAFDCDGESKNNLVLKVNNEEMLCAKAYHNDKLNVSLLSSLKDGEAMCFVQCSLPKFVSNNNLASLNFEQTNESLQGIQRELTEIGISADVYTSIITRLDVFKNIEVSKSYEYYSPIFQSLQMSRRKKRDYGTTYLYENSQREICIYDKIEEMKIKYKSEIDKYLNPVQLQSNVIRFENRLIKPASVKKGLGYGRIKYLLTEEGYGALEDNYYDTMKYEIFKLPSVGVEKIYIERDRLLSELTYFKNCSSYRYWLNKFFSHYGLLNIQQHISYEDFTDVVLEVRGINSNDNQARRIKSDIRKKWVDSKTQGTLFNSIENGVTQGHLYNELKEKMFSRVG